MAFLQNWSNKKNLSLSDRIIQQKLNPAWSVLGGGLDPDPATVEKKEVQGGQRHLETTYPHLWVTSTNCEEGSEADCSPACTETD